MKNKLKEYFYMYGFLQTSIIYFEYILESLNIPILELNIRNLFYTFISLLPYIREFSNKHFFFNYPTDLVIWLKTIKWKFRKECNLTISLILQFFEVVVSRTLPFSTASDNIKLYFITIVSASEKEFYSYTCIQFKYLKTYG